VANDSAGVTCSSELIAEKAGYCCREQTGRITKNSKLM